MFMPSASDAKVGPEGSRSSKIAIVGLAPAADEIKTGRCFTGMAGGVLEQCLHAAGIIRAQCYVTNVIKEKLPNTKRKRNDEASYYNERTGRFTPKGQVWVDELREELQDVEANIFVALGALASSALCGRHKIGLYHGYVCESTLLPNRKVLPTYHPAASIHGSYIERWYTSNDLKKAKRHSETPDFAPFPTAISIPSTLDEALAILDEMYHAEKFACDIEVVNFEVSCISFCSNPKISFSIPLYHHWTEEEELMIWDAIARALGNPHSIKVLQNAIFDIHFLAARNNILVRGPIHDTMIAHHIMYPDFRKGLSFLAACYTDLPYWKDMVKFNNIKSEA